MLAIFRHWRRGGARSIRPSGAAGGILTVERLRGRLGFLLGIIDSAEAGPLADARLRQARELAAEAAASLETAARQPLPPEELLALSTRLTASEALVLDQMPAEYLLACTHEHCAALLAQAEGPANERRSAERKAVAAILAKLSEMTSAAPGELRTLFLQTRQRLDAAIAMRLSSAQMAQQLMALLWRRTAAAILVCLLPIGFFLHQRYYAEEEVVESEEKAEMERGEVDIDEMEAAKRVLPKLRAGLGALPTQAQKAQLDTTDVEAIEKGMGDDEDGFGALVRTLNPENEGFSDRLRDLAKALQTVAEKKLPDGKNEEALLTELRDRKDALEDLESYIADAIDAGRKLQQQSASTPENYWTPSVSRRSDSPVPRLATLFSVLVMGIAGAFVSNYSRCCALLEAGVSHDAFSSDRSIRIRYSPIIGALLAFALSEVFGGHLLQGELFPLTEEMSRWTDLIWHGKAFSKLLVWSFVAGLSENYILSALGQLVGKLGFEEKQPPGTPA